jgi:uncharacterized membrane protein
MHKKIHKIKSDKHSDYFDHKHSFKQDKSVKYISILPHPTTLESYEEISPGITTKLGTMLVKEMEFRHRMEALRMRGVQSIYRLGQFLSTLTAMVIIFCSLMIFKDYNDKYFASVICVSGFTFLTIINVLGFKRITRISSNPTKKKFKKNI